ncbi:MAG: DNA replication and repair protein RecF [Acidobacteriota bacterium]|nr:DNA replication and repair protein RecF [Blastocatellia bacterium]MDW8240176.1 DNA replication and repair protein RecF [Acidobacteriota bacterium]
MIITKLQAQCFRNIVQDEFEPSSRLNILYGSNAQGKTNWLEAIHLLATTTSFRTARLSETLLHNQQEAILRAQVRQHELEKQLAIQLTPRSKALFVNGKREPSSRYLSHLTVFICSLEQMNVIRGEPEHRRHFLDQGAMSVDPTYAHVLGTYNRIIKQKNHLLRQIAQGSRSSSLIEQLHVWNQQLIQYGTKIHHARTDYTQKLQQALHGHLFGQEQINVRYRSSLEGHGQLNQYAGLLSERLKLRWDAELAVGYALVGPHRDDLEIRFDGRDVRRFASAGQQRSALLILDLARISVYNALSHEYPVFLVDDVDAELDRRRIDVLLDYLSDKTQTFLTTSKREIATSYFGRADVFRVEDGRIIVESNA